MVTVRALGVAQSRITSRSDPAAIRLELQRIAETVFWDTSGYIYRRAFLNARTRRHANNWMFPLVDAAVVQ